MNKFINGLCTLVNLGSIIGLAAIGLKRNNDCYKAECKLIDAEMELLVKELEGIVKDSEIRHLKKELEELKGKEEA